MEQQIVQVWKYYSDISSRPQNPQPAPNDPLLYYDVTLCVTQNLQIAILSHKFNLT